jgi:EAL domain-containing protein (putative c-di-GMP-specific phosphodiesterase class I)
MGCHQIQGYLVSPPVPPEKIPAFAGRSFFAPPVPSA